MSLQVDFDLFGLRSLIEAAFREDVGRGDLTVETLLSPELRERPVDAHIIAKAPGVIAGLPVAAACYGSLDKRIAFRAVVKDGEAVESGQRVAHVHGPAGHLLTAERTALNFLGRLSGIATLTRRFVEAVAGTGAVICDTRKTTPGHRMLEKYATDQGGAKNHRLGLFDQVLIKENHLEAAGAGIDAAVRLAVESLSGNPRPVIGVETKDLAEFDVALGTPADLILLDNFAPEEVAEAVHRRGSATRPALEASGGVTLENVRAYAETGVDRISVGALTHSAPTLDLSCLFEWRPQGATLPTRPKGENTPS